MPDEVFLARMNERIRLSMSQEAFKSWIQTFSFKEHGDTYENDHFDWLDGVFPRLQEFWRVFVVPLTNRMNSEVKDTSRINLRPNIDKCLQRLPGLSYSLFIHLCEAKEAIGTKRTKHDLMPIYSRLGAALDCFERLVDDFFRLLTRIGQRGPVSEIISQECFAQMAKGHLKKNESKVQRYYCEHVVIPPLRVPVKDLMAEYFGETDSILKDYRRRSQPIRSFRNRLVHDIRIGVVEFRNDLFAPKPEKIADYSRWSDVQAAESDPAKFKSDFRNAYEGASEDWHAITRLMNDLYGKILQECEAAFYSPESRLRALYGLAFTNVAEPACPVSLSTIQSSGAISPGPYTTSGTGSIDERHHSASGYFKATSEPGPDPNQHDT